MPITVPKIHSFSKKAQDPGPYIMRTQSLALGSLRHLTFLTTIPKQEITCLSPCCPTLNRIGWLTKELQHNTSMHSEVLWAQNTKRAELRYKRDLPSNSRVDEKAVSSVVSVGTSTCGSPDRVIGGSSLDPTFDAIKCQRFRNNRTKTNDSLM